MNRDHVASKVLWELVASIAAINRRLQAFAEQQEELLRSINQNLQDFVDQETALIAAMAALSDGVSSTVQGLVRLQQQPELQSEADHAPTSPTPTPTMREGPFSPPQPLHCGGELQLPSAADHTPPRRPCQEREGEHLRVMELRSGRREVSLNARRRPYRRSK